MPHPQGPADSVRGVAGEGVGDGLVRLNAHAPVAALAPDGRVFEHPGKRTAREKRHPAALGQVDAVAANRHALGNRRVSSRPRFLNVGKRFIGWVGSKASWNARARSLHRGWNGWDGAPAKKPRSFVVFHKRNRPAKPAYHIKGTPCSRRRRLSASA